MGVRFDRRIAALVACRSRAAAVIMAGAPPPPVMPSMPFKPELAHLALAGTASLADDLDSTARPPTLAPVPLLLTPLLRARVLADKMVVHLRDRRKIFGILRSFDQFANVVLEEAFERVIVGKRYADVPLGLYVIRGENVVLLGQIVRARALPAIQHLFFSVARRFAFAPPRPHDLTPSRPYDTTVCARARGRTRPRRPSRRARC